MKYAQVDFTHQLRFESLKKIKDFTNMLDVKPFGSMYGDEPQNQYVVLCRLSIFS